MHLCIYLSYLEMSSYLFDLLNQIAGSATTHIYVGSVLCILWLRIRVLDFWFWVTNLTNDEPAFIILKLLNFLWAKMWIWILSLESEEAWSQLAMPQIRCATQFLDMCCLQPHATMACHSFLALCLTRHRLFSCQTLPQVWLWFYLPYTFYGCSICLMSGVENLGRNQTESLVLLANY